MNFQNFKEPVGALGRGPAILNLRIEDQLNYVKDHKEVLRINIEAIGSLISIANTSGALMLVESINTLIALFAMLDMRPFYSQTSETYAVKWC